MVIACSPGWSVKLLSTAARTTFGKCKARPHSKVTRPWNPILQRNTNINAYLFPLLMEWGANLDMYCKISHHLLLRLYRSSVFAKKVSLKWTPARGALYIGGPVRTQQISGHSNRTLTLQQPNSPFLHVGWMEWNCSFVDIVKRQSAWLQERGCTFSYCPCKSQFYPRYHKLRAYFSPAIVQQAELPSHLAP